MLRGQLGLTPLPAFVLRTRGLSLRQGALKTAFSILHVHIRNAKIMDKIISSHDRVTCHGFKL